MLRLTICSGKDGRYLARIIDQDGYPFVLDYGDRRLIDDVAQRLARGFTRWRFGKLLNIQPQDPDMLLHLSDYYAGEGYLVVLDEPTWTGRDEEESQRVDSDTDALRSSSMVAPVEVEEDEVIEPFYSSELVDLIEDRPTEFANNPNATDAIEDGPTEFISQVEGVDDDDDTDVLDDVTEMVEED